jgi:hypothetical protein
MEEIIIVNITTKSFFRYTKTTETDIEYNNILVELLQPDEEDLAWSHWTKKDKIVFCPTHLRNYVERNCNELFIN